MSFLKTIANINWVLLLAILLLFLTDSELANVQNSVANNYYFERLDPTAKFSSPKKITPLLIDLEQREFSPEDSKVSSESAKLEKVPVEIFSHLVVWHLNYIPKDNNPGSWSFDDFSNAYRKLVDGKDEANLRKKELIINLKLPDDLSQEFDFIQVFQRLDTLVEKYGNCTPALSLEFPYSAEQSCVEVANVLRSVESRAKEFELFENNPLSIHFSVNVGKEFKVLPPAESIRNEFDHAKKCYEDYKRKADKQAPSYLIVYHRAKQNEANNDTYGELIPRNLEEIFTNLAKDLSGNSGVIFCPTLFPAAYDSKIKTGLKQYYLRSTRIDSLNHSLKESLVIAQAHNKKHSVDSAWYVHRDSTLMFSDKSGLEASLAFFSQKEVGLGFRFSEVIPTIDRDVDDADKTRGMMKFILKKAGKIKDVNSFVKNLVRMKGVFGPHNESGETNNDAMTPDKWYWQTVIRHQRLGAETRPDYLLFVLAPLLATRCLLPLFVWVLFFLRSPGHLNFLNMKFLYNDLGHRYGVKGISSPGLRLWGDALVWVFITFLFFFSWKGYTTRPLAILLFLVMALGVMMKRIYQIFKLVGKKRGVSLLSKAWKIAKPLPGMVYDSFDSAEAEKIVEYVKEQDYKDSVFSQLEKSQLTTFDNIQKDKLVFKRLEQVMGYFSFDYKGDKPGTLFYLAPGIDRAVNQLDNVPAGPPPAGLPPVLGNHQGYDTSFANNKILCFNFAFLTAVVSFGMLYLGSLWQDSFLGQYDYAWFLLYLIPLAVVLLNYKNYYVRYLLKFFLRHGK